MRFRATVENVPIFFREFNALQACFSLSLAGSGIIQAVEKLQKKCIIKFTEDEMHIICNDDANEGGIQVWSWVASASSYFLCLTPGTAWSRSSRYLLTTEYNPTRTIKSPSRSQRKRFFLLSGRHRLQHHRLR